VSRVLLTFVALPAFLIMLLTGCGQGTSDDVIPQAPVSTTGGTVNTDLTVTIDYGGGKTDTWTLTCDPAGGTHPDPAKACAALAAKGRTALPPTRKDVMCTQIFGGEQKATVEGTWNGEAVSASFSRTNGCEISRWKALEGLLPTVPGAAGAQ
jgi:Subtilisin inhibitor-like